MVEQTMRLYTVLYWFNLVYTGLILLYLLKLAILVSTGNNTDVVMVEKVENTGEVYFY